MDKMLKKYAAIGLVVLSGLIAGPRALAQDATWRIDSEHSTARLFLASSRNSEAGINVGVARANGVIVRSAGDTAPSEVNFTIYPADKTASADRSEQDRSGGNPGNNPDYTVIRFKSTRVVPVGRDSFRVTGDLTLTYVERLATNDPSEAYAGPLYGPAVTDSVTQPAGFEFRQVSPSGARRARRNVVEWSASSTMNGEDFPELLKAVSSTNWPTFVADEKCAMPSHAGEGFSGPVCAGTAIEVAARADLQCEMPSVGEDFAGEVCSETTPGATTNAAEQRAQARRHSGGEQIPLVVNEVKMQLDLQLTRVDSPMPASSGQ
jgi:polyisoprenoid-binding protein YceI